MKRWFLVVLPLALLAVLIVLRLRANGAVAAAAAHQREARLSAPAVVSLVPAAVQTIEHQFKSVGTVEAPADVKIASRVTGRIQFLSVQPGDRVSAGEILVRLDPAEAEAGLQEQQAALETARYRLAQAQVAEAPNDVSVMTQVRQQQAAVASALASYNQVKQNYAGQVASAQSSVTDAQGRVDAAEAAINNARAVIGSTQASLENARSQYNRAHELFTQGYIAAQDVDTARTGMNVQIGAVSVAQAQLSSAEAAHSSAQAQKASAESQLAIARRKGLSDIAVAQAQWVQAGAALQYARSNTAQKPAYRQNLAALQASVNLAQASVNDARVLLAETTIRAPMDGYVVSRVLDPGAVVTAGQPILTVRYLKQVWVTVPVPEEVSRKVFEGQQAQITFDGLPSKTFTGIVTQVTPSADPTTRQFPIRVTLDNSQNLIKPGMYARVTLVTDRVPDAIVIPPEAILKGPGPAAVMVVDEQGTAHRKAVMTGASTSDRIAILSGLQPGDRVVTVSAMPLKDGQKVKVGR
ncbi:MAG: efflux RND transporter periplasmic adaptor subunit [Chloroflexi bacterium]|nr:efflux RND transporter periplasmic adaptor subunit [Chloroflexota bacterium]